MELQIAPEFLWWAEEWTGLRWNGRCLDSFLSIQANTCGDELTVGTDQPAQVAQPAERDAFLGRRQFPQARIRQTQSSDPEGASVFITDCSTIHWSSRSLLALHCLRIFTVGIFPSPARRRMVNGCRLRYLGTSSIVWMVGNRKIPQKAAPLDPNCHSQSLLVPLGLGLYPVGYPRISPQSVGSRSWQRTVRLQLKKQRPAVRCWPFACVYSMAH